MRMAHSLALVAAMAVACAAAAAPQEAKPAGVTVDGLTVTVETVQPEFRPGRGPVMKVTFRNDADKAIKLQSPDDFTRWRMTCGPYELVFSEGDAKDRMATQKLKLPPRRMVELQPGKAHEVVADLSWAFLFVREDPEGEEIVRALPDGKYAFEAVITLQGDRHVGGTFWGGTIRSKPIEFVVDTNAMIPAGTNPPGMPLKATLELKQTTFVLPRDKAGRAWQRRLEATARQGGQLPDPPAIELVLRIRNESKESITFQMGHPLGGMDLVLNGPGARKFARPIAMTGPVTTIRSTLGPGESMTVSVDALRCGFAEATHLYWTRPGVYTLQAEYAMADAQGMPTWLGRNPQDAVVTVVSSPVTIRVTNPDGTTDYTEPKPLSNEQFAELLRRLGDERYKVREQASQSLLDAAAGSEADERRVAEALDAEALDPEVRARLQRILDELRGVPAEPAHPEQLDVSGVLHTKT